MSNSGFDAVRLRATLGSPELARVLAALRNRLERGKPLAGPISLTSTSNAERSAIDSFLGRKASRGDSLQIDLGEVAEIFMEAGICRDLTAAVEFLCGPIVDRRAEARQHEEAWASAWQTTRHDLASRPSLLPWLSEVEASGLLKRLSRDDPAQASRLMSDLVRLVHALPVHAEPLAAFAARLLGNAHALDPGTPLATLAVRAVVYLRGSELEDDAEGRRTAWAEVGVMCDELSTPALVLNLPADNDSLLARLLRAGAQAGEPLHLSLRLLLRHPLSNDPALADREIFVCENPTILGLAATRLGARSAALVCVNGQFATPTKILLRQLTEAGARLRYHGDFDVGGLRIARRVLSHPAASPWRYSVSDYLAAPKSELLVEDPGPTPWSPELATALRTERKAVHEEAIADSLVEDLALHRKGAGSECRNP